MLSTWALLEIFPPETRIHFYIYIYIRYHGGFVTGLNMGHFIGRSILIYRLGQNMSNLVTGSRRIDNIFWVATHEIYVLHGAWRIHVGLRKRKEILADTIFGEILYFSSIISFFHKSLLSSIASSKSWISITLAFIFICRNDFFKNNNVREPKMSLFLSFLSIMGRSRIVRNYHQCLISLTQHTIYDIHHGIVYIPNIGFSLLSAMTSWDNIICDT